MVYHARHDRGSQGCRLPRAQGDEQLGGVCASHALHISHLVREEVGLNLRALTRICCGACVARHCASEVRRAGV